MAGRDPRVITLTHTTTTQFRNCRRRYYHRNVQHLVRKYAGEARGIGYAVHRGIEQGSVQAGLDALGERPIFDQQDYDQLELARVIVHAMLTGYFKHFDPLPNYRPEIQFRLPILNPGTGHRSRSYQFAGKVDGLCQIDGRYFLVEYKTTSQLGPAAIDNLPLDAQVTAYIYALQRFLDIRIDGVIYRFLRRPSIRQRQNETAEQFRDRLTQDYINRPDFYFREEQLYRLRDDLDRYERDLWNLTQDMLHARRHGLWYMNTSRCQDFGGCDYIPICRGDHDALDLFMREEPHTELKEDGTNDHQAAN